MFDPNPQLDALLQKLVHPQLKVIDPSLDRILRLLEALGNPQDSLPPVIHIAGTNGKGSLVATLRAILGAAGYRVHSYTSPHLVRFNERIRLNDAPIEDAALVPLLERILAMQKETPATFFEATTAAAFLAFAAVPADIILLETGMGGRLDATNVIAKPVVTAITPIGIDHAEFLGETLAEIAAEKAAIMKPGSVCVVGPQSLEALAVIEARGLPLFRYGSEWNCQRESEEEWMYQSANRRWILPLPALQGAYQIANAGTALAVVEQLENFELTQAHAASGLRSVNWPARLQPLTAGYWFEQLPRGWGLYLDGGHNPHAAAVLAKWARQQPPPVFLVLGMLKNKDLAGYLACWRGVAERIYAVPIPQESNALAPQEIAAIAQEKDFLAEACESAEEALRKLPPAHKATVLIAGSLYLAGHILAKN